MLRLSLALKSSSDRFHAQAHLNNVYINIFCMYVSITRILFSFNFSANKKPCVAVVEIWNQHDFLLDKRYQFRFNQAILVEFQYLNLYLIFCDYYQSNNQSVKETSMRSESGHASVSIETFVFLFFLEKLKMNRILV